jgi:hypothetical protein
MSRYVITLNSGEDRNRAFNVLSQAPDGARVEFKAPKRSVPQNDRMWAMLTDVATQVPWAGKKRTPDEWKLLFLDAWRREVRVAPALDGNGVVNLGRSSSDLSKEEMSELIECIAAWGAENGVTFHDEKAA